MNDAELIVSLKQKTAVAGITSQEFCDYMISIDRVPRGTFTIDVAVVSRPNNMRAVARAWNSTRDAIIAKRGKAA